MVCSFPLLATRLWHFVCHLHLHEIVLRIDQKLEIFESRCNKIGINVSQQTSDKTCCVFFVLISNSHRHRHKLRPTMFLEIDRHDRLTLAVRKVHTDPIQIPLHAHIHTKCIDRSHRCVRVFTHSNEIDFDIDIEINYLRARSTIHPRIERAFQRASHCVHRDTFQFPVRSVIRLCFHDAIVSFR